MHLAVTAHPTAAWVWRQLVEATAVGPPARRTSSAIGTPSTAATSRERAAALGIETLLTPVRAPRANAVAERVIGTLRRECLDHVILLDERHLRAILAEYVDYYNHDRPSRRRLHPPAAEGTPAGRTRSLGPRHVGLVPAHPPAGCTTCTEFAA